MARVEPDALSHRALSRVYIAGTLREAREVEAWLTTSGVDYVVQVEPFRASIFFGPRHGAAFYVTADQAEYCRTHLAADGLGRGVLRGEDEDEDEDGDATAIG